MRVIGIGYNKFRGDFWANRRTREMYPQRGEQSMLV